MSRLPFVLGAALLFVGCAGGGSIGAALGVVLLGASLVLAACLGAREGSQAGDGVVASDGADASDADECTGEYEAACVDGQTVAMCCPAGASCNYGWSVACNGVCVPVGQCGDAGATETTETVSDVDDGDVTCDGVFENGCVAGQIVALCCPLNVECNYGQNLVDCGGGTCVESPATCP